MTRTAAITIAKKLKALAEKSEGGERIAATKKLKSFCVIHSLDEEEYSIETIKATIPFVGNEEKMLLSSIMCMVMEMDAVKGQIKDGKFIFQCTPRQFEDIREAFQFYKKVYYDYAEGVMMALIVRNEIKNTKINPVDFRMDDMTEEERKEYDELVRKGKPETPPPDESDPTTGSFDAGKPSAPETDAESREKRDQKDARIRAMFMVVGPTKWSKKTRAKLFLR